MINENQYVPDPQNYLASSQYPGPGILFLIIEFNSIYSYPK